MNDMKSAIGEVSSQLMAQSKGTKLAAATERLAQAIDERERAELDAQARSAPFSRVPLWAFYLPITRRQMLVLGRVFSFQCSTNRDGTPGEYRMSLSSGARELHMANRAEMQKAMTPLIKLGYVKKRSNGERRPATYTVDTPFCITEARRNGYPG